MKLTARNYFSRKANLEYISVSQIKSFGKCQAATLAELKGKYKREKSTALLVGSYVDSYFEGALDSFKKENPELFKKDGTLKADYIQAEQIIKRIEKDKLFMKYMSGEKQVIMTGNINGVAVKIKIDVLHPDKIVDLKIMGSFKGGKMPEGQWLPWFEFWGYDLQGAVYQEVYRQNTGDRLPFYLAAATKEKATDLDIVHLPQKYLDYAMENVKRDIEYYDGIKRGIFVPERCEKCEYCKNTKRLTEPTEADEFYLF